MIAEFIRKKREEKGLSQRELAYQANVSNTEISRIENGSRPKPSPKILEKLSGPLGVTYDELMIEAGYLKKAIEINDVIPELKEFADKLNTMPKKKRDELLKVGNQLFDLIMKDINDDKKDGGNK